MALNASDLQRRHELEGAPDPFPSLVESGPAPTKQKQAQPAQLDTGSEDAFPSLASTAPASTPAAASAWGAGPRIKPAAKAPVFVDSFNLSSLDLGIGKDGKAATLGEVMKQVMAKYKVKIEASANQKARQTTFHVKAESQKELDKAKRSLLALLSPTITLILQAPVSTIASIIGPKGATLKQIRDQTSVRVDIPKRDTATPIGNGHANGTSSGKASPSLDDDEEEPTVPVTLTGPQPLAYEAQEILKQIIASKTSRTTSRVRDIPAHVLPFILPRRGNFLQAAQGGDVSLSLNQPAREISASGDREAVGRVIESIKATVEGFSTNLTSVKMSLPKRQHRLLAGRAAEEVMAKSKCAVVVPPYEEATEELTIWGQPADLGAGLSSVMEQANSKYIHEFPLPGPITLSKELATYIKRIDFVKTLKAEKSDVEVYLPSVTSPKSTLAIDLIGNKADTDVLVKRLSELIGKLIGATKTVEVDWLLHKVIQGKNAKKLKQFNEAHNVLVYFPVENTEQSSVLLVYDPSSPSASPIPDEKQKHLSAVEKELLKLAKDAADVKTELVSVEKRWQAAVVGSGGTTLNAIIGEDTTLSIKVGADAGEDSEDVILVRGVSSDVDRVVREILKIVEDAKNDEIVSSYFTEFDIEKEYVGRIVGAHGAGVNRLRDQLGVKVDVSDDFDEKEKESKKKKSAHAKSKVKITGRKENAEEAKKRILAQVDRLADETFEILKIPSQYHSSLIGEKGKYAIRLEDKYAVKITFPRHSSDSGEPKTREQLKSDEVLVKGGKKGVAGAKSELLEALEYERETNNVLKFTVPTRSVARILGRGGASINEIKDDTNTRIDVEKGEDGGAVTSITLTGTKKGITAAKAAILAIAEQVHEEATDSVTIESKYHRSIIGAGGQGLKDLIAKCGGPSDSRSQAGLIRFPRQGETGDEVRLRGEPKVVAKLKEELEKLAASLRDRVIVGVDIPAQQHRALIGRGGQTLNDLQNKFTVQIQFPGSRSYGQVGEPENSEELTESDPANIVKVTGSRSNVEAAVADLKSHIKPPMPEGINKDVTVPVKYQHAISQQGNFFRTLRGYGVQVDQTVQSRQTSLPERPASENASSARIDDEGDNAAIPEFEWQVVENYQDAEEGDSIWTLKGRDQAGLEKAEKLINDAIQNASKLSHVGFLTLADRSSFPRIVGSKGANVARVRSETGADVTVGRENNTIIIVGSETAIVDAKEAILKLANNNNNRGPRRYND
ncbi:SCP160 protein [Ephemerocybe angulata]|uniref:SCP160 protein n=1 Tax=Ephemerocybe angulata TaxID=980116 RepID=A0A8H6M9M6_9AGAR|nr:SCP160 protein [Tulosesus angulatus]